MIDLFEFYFVDRTTGEQKYLGFQLIAPFRIAFKGGGYDFDSLQTQQANSTKRGGNENGGRTRTSRHDN